MKLLTEPNVFSAVRLMCAFNDRIFPQTKVATLCEPGEVYLAQHMGEQGRWVSSTDKKSCMTDKLEILEYCKKVSKRRRNL